VVREKDREQAVRELEEVFLQKAMNVKMHK